MCVCSFEVLVELHLIQVRCEIIIIDLIHNHGELFKCYALELQLYNYVY